MTFQSSWKYTPNIFGAQEEVRIAGGLRDGRYRAGSREALRVIGLVAQDRARIVEEGDARGRIVLEESAQYRLPEIIEARP